MLYIRHRINTALDLSTVPREHGIELDLRERDDKIILQHDPFRKGEVFEDFIKEFHHEFMILNFKTEGIEEKALEMIWKKGIRNYFLLDISFPVIVKLARKGIKDIAVRFSEHEPIEQCLALKSMVKWVWVDCFSKCPLDKSSYGALKKHFKICIVSPELQNHSLDRIDEFKSQFAGLDIDAICTKRPDLWQGGNRPRIQPL